MDSGHVDDRIWSAYADHLTDADLHLLASASGTGLAPDELRRNPGVALPLLDHRAVHDAVLGSEGRAAGVTIAVSPFLVFAVAVHRYAADLALPGERAPGAAERGTSTDGTPTDGDELRDFLGPPARRLFLAELLTSFVTPGEPYPVTVDAPGGGRPDAGLDLMSLPRVLEQVPTADRPGVYRRFGDVALFLAGVFPDQARRVFGQVQPELLLMMINPVAVQRSLPTAAISLLEWLGSRWYRTAYELAPVRSSRLAVVAEVADRFAAARTVLDHIARRHLLPAGLSWPRPPDW